MIKKMTCIQCPQGCQLSVDVENGYVLKVTGNKCPKGEAYAKQEIENPVRTLTSTVLAEGLSLKMVPVKTSKPIPKNKLMAVMQEIRKIKINKPMRVNQSLVKNILGLGADLVLTRNAE